VSPKDPKVYSLGSPLFYPPKAVGEGVTLGTGVFDCVAVGLVVRGSVGVMEGVMVCVNVELAVKVGVNVKVLLGVNVNVLG
jgi:hypothetical protein